MALLQKAHYSIATKFVGMLWAQPRIATVGLLITLTLSCFVLLHLINVVFLNPIWRRHCNKLVHPPPPKAEAGFNLGAPVGFAKPANVYKRLKPRPQRRRCKSVECAGDEEEVVDKWGASCLFSSANEAINFSNDIRLSLTLKRSDRPNIIVGVLIHSNIPHAGLEFFFSSGEDMAVCVGVGLGKAMVSLSSDFSTIEIHETDAKEWGLQEALWQPVFLGDASCQLEYNIQSIEDEPPVQVLGLHAKIQKYGVGFKDAASLYNIVDESLDEEARHTSPLLCDVAKFIMSRAISCANDAEKGSSSGGPQEQCQNDGMQLQSSINCRGDGQGSGSRDGGDPYGDDEKNGANKDGGSTRLTADDDDDAVCTIIVHPLCAGDVQAVESCPGLESAAIATKLVFKLRREGPKRGEIRSIAIRAVSRIELVAAEAIDFNLDDANRFGWYHNGIEITLGCTGMEGAALLDQGSGEILDTSTSKCTAVRSSTSSTADTSSGGKQFGAKIGASAVAGIEGKAASSGSRKKEDATSSGQNIEMEIPSVCKGFMYRESSTTDSPARVKFTLSYPLRRLSIWDNKEFLLGQGLFSTIAPEITGTWIALDFAEKAPYKLLVKRVMKLVTRAGSAEEKDAVEERKQACEVSLWVNHAMTHLRRHNDKISLLRNGDDSVKDVLGFN